MATTTKKAKKETSKIMGGFGKKGVSALREKLGEEGFRKHMSKIAKRRWKKTRAEQAANAPINRRRAA